MNHPPVLLITVNFQRGRDKDDVETSLQLFHENLRKVYPDIELEVYPNNSDIPTQVWQKTTFLITSRIYPRDREQAPNIRWVQSYSAGLNVLPSLPIFTAENIKFSTASGVHAPVIAEHVVMLLLTHYHKFIKQLSSIQFEHVWPQDRFSFSHEELLGKKVGILGYGSIGRQVARVLSCFGCNIVVLNHSKKVTQDERRLTRGINIERTGDPNGDIPQEWYGMHELYTFLKTLDIVVIAAPSTASTHHVINTEALSKMKNTAVIVNIARGSLIDQSAMVEALYTNKIGGALLDVMEPEPINPDNLLLSAPNVILTPHVSGLTDQYAPRMMKLFVDNLGRFSRSECLINEVDIARGY